MQMPMTPPAGMLAMATSKPKGSVFDSGFAMALADDSRQPNGGSGSNSVPGTGDGEASLSDGSGASSHKGDRDTDAEQHGANASELLLVSTDESLERLCKALGKMAGAAADVLDDLKHPMHTSYGLPHNSVAAPGTPGGIAHKHTPIQLTALAARSHPLLQVLHKAVKASHGDLLKAAVDQDTARKREHSGGSVPSKTLSAPSPLPRTPAFTPSHTPLTGMPRHQASLDSPPDRRPLPSLAGQDTQTESARTVDGLVDAADAPVLAMPSHEILAARCMAVVFQAKQDRALLYRALLCLSQCGEVFRELQVSRRWA